MTCAVIMQPTYLPWIGYFDLIDQSDVFVFLDNVQFNKRSWQQRNRIRTAKGLEWLTVPVYTKGRRHQLISEVQIVLGSSFPEDHVKAVKFNYAKASYFESYFSEFQAILLSSGSSLSELNQKLIRWLAEKFGLETRFETSSSLKVNGRRSELLANICEAVGATTYLSPVGSADYLLEEQEQFSKRGISVFLQGYAHPKYRQVFSPFMPFACALDLLLNEGPKSIEIIRSGRKKRLSLEEYSESVQKEV